MKTDERDILQPLKDESWSILDI